jgi:glutamine cyclotransferase
VSGAGERPSKRRTRTAEIVREYGPFPGVSSIGGVTFDGKKVWMAIGQSLQSFDPESGETGSSIPVVADAGTAFDGAHLFQLSGTQIRKIDPATGAVVATLPAPGEGPFSGMTWAEGTLWVATYRAGHVFQIDAETGRVLRTLETTRFVTGVTWVEGELWHGTLSDGHSDLRRIDPATGEELDRLEMPAGALVSGLESAGDVLYCGGAQHPKVRAIRRPTG